MSKSRLFFCCLGLSFCLLQLSVIGMLRSGNSLYLIPLLLSSLGTVFTAACLYEEKALASSETRKDYHFYFIDNTPPSRDLLWKDFNRRM